MNIIGHIRKIKLASFIEKRGLDYNNNWSPKSRLNLQLQKFNNHWQCIINHIPYYKNISRQNNIPDTFSSWNEFIEKVPVTTKETIQQCSHAMTNNAQKTDFMRITGGTTSKPIQLPAWFSEHKNTQSDMWMARKWYGITPSSKLFMIWGHSHVLGHGIKGRFNSISRQFKDWLVQYKRFSAYNMNQSTMRQAAMELIKFRPEYVLGYSVALDAFARANQDLASELRHLKVKVVIGAAEGFPHDDSEKIIENIFNCPIAMEYGAVETDLIGHTVLGNGYMVFWQNYFLEATDKGTNGGYILRITSLYNRCFPLIRYEIGDEVELYEGSVGMGLWQFRSVKGRCNLFVLLKDGTKVHSEAFTHCVRDFAKISSYQIVQSKDQIKMLIVARNGYSKLLESKIRDRLKRIHPELYDVHFEKVDQQRQTISGKTPMIFRED